MIRHIVTWRLRPESPEAKAAAVAAIEAALVPLVGVIDGLQSLIVRQNAAYPDDNWDAVLVADFDSLEALVAYQDHPQHQAAAAVPRSFTTDRAAVDFEV